MNDCVKSDGVKYIWTSGRKCDFDGCNRADLQPTIVNGWFWSGSEAKVPPTDQRALGDWSNTGGDGRPQPDNREDDVRYTTSYWPNLLSFYILTNPIGNHLFQTGGWALLGHLEQLLQRWHQVARRRLQPRETLHLRRQRAIAQLCPLPQPRGPPLNISTNASFDWNFFNNSFIFE